jgi:hypothetical protein
VPFYRYGVDEASRFRRAPGGRQVAVFADRRPVAHTRRGGLVVFDLPTRAGPAADWAVVAPGRRS